MNKNILFAGLMIVTSWSIATFGDDKPNRSEPEQSVFEKYADDIALAQDLIKKHGTKAIFLGSVVAGLVFNQSEKSFTNLVRVPLLATILTYHGVKTVPEAWENGLFKGTGTFVWNVIIKVPCITILGTLAGLAIRQSLGNFSN